MDVKIQTVHFSGDEKLIELVRKKVEKLNTFHDKITVVHVFLKLDNIVHALKDKIVELRVHVPKHDFFVKASSTSFEESFESAYESIVNKLKRQKQKQAA